MNEFGQKGKVPLSERLSVAPEEASALTGIGLTSIREAISSGDLKAKKHGRRTIILPDDLRIWLKMLPDAGKPILRPDLALLRSSAAVVPPAV